MLETDNAVVIHVKNLLLLMTEIFKTQHSLNSAFMTEIFVSKHNQYSLKNEHLIQRLRSRATTFEEKHFFLWGKVVA